MSEVDVISGGGVGGGTFSLPSAAAARELGDLFEYKLKDPITIAKNRSALVPIVNSLLSGRRRCPSGTSAPGRRVRRARCG
jgi:hypothetical protein